ncbi:hemolysin III family protein [Candidatus Parcubacteria bacterium]|nr:hemolysin III family protein [Candidatus Parcubacteria bacterium]
MKNIKDNEPLSSLTHLIGFILSIAALVLMIVMAAKYSTAWHIVSFSIFGASLILLYLASTVYHFVPKSNKHKNTFRRIDLSFIFVLIAGTYTPIVLVPLRGAWGWTIFGIVWGIALIGIIIQIFKIKFKAWSMIALYISMGWIVVIALPVLLNSLSRASFAWLLAGGILYTLGVIFLVLDKVLPRHRWFGMHEIFHVFVLAGSFSHFWLMYRYIVYIN